MEKSRSLDGRGIAWRLHPLSNAMIGQNIPELAWEPEMLPPAPPVPNSLVHFSLHDGGFSISCRNALLPFSHHCSVIQFDLFGESEGNLVEYEAGQKFSFSPLGVCTPEIDPKSRCEVAVAVALTSGCWLLDSRPFADYLRVEVPPAPKKMLHLREALRRSDLCPPFVDQPFWEWDPPAQKRLAAMSRRLCLLGADPRHVVSDLLRNPSQPFRALVAAALGYEPDAAVDISRSHPDIRSFFRHHWPAIEQDISGLTPQQVMDLWHVEPSHRRTIATWIVRKPSANVAIADRFLAARLALVHLSVNIPSAAQSRLGVDLSALKELVNRAPETSPAEAEKIQAQWNHAEAIVLGEYGLDHSQPLAAPLDQVSPTSIALRELEVRILWWVSVLSSRTLPHQDQLFPVTASKPASVRVREGCAMLRRLTDHLALIKLPEQPPPLEKSDRKAGPSRDAIHQRLEIALSELRQAVVTARSVTFQSAIDWNAMEKDVERLEAMVQTIASHCVRNDWLQKS